MYEVTGAHPLSAPPPREPTRRWFLAGGVAALLGAAGGVIVELTRPRHNAIPPPPPHPPAALRAAAEAERRLIADLDATTGGDPAVRRVILRTRADHAAHLRVLDQLLAGFPHHGRRPTEHRPPGTPRTLAQLRGAEQRAAAAAAGHAAQLSGGYAALLASIAACEATHAELLR